MNKNLKIILLILGCLIVSFIIRMFIITGIIFLLFNSAKVEVNKDINKYNNYMGVNAKEQYKIKWGMNETIFPNKITNNMNVKDYKMVYYDPWDKQFLSYLVVEYDDDNYQKEVERLKNYKSNNYIGYYGVTGFSKYQLLAMNADSYYGFVYALTDNDNTIIYVEMIFCNYFYDLEYKKYIPNDYLPDGFDAKLDNEYQKKMLEED